MTVKRDIFYLDKVFPEADKIFSENFKNAKEIIKNGIIVLDTNVLLVPYDTSEKNVYDIKSIYLNYKSQDRLYIPARVAREFANNRANRIGEIFLQIRQIKDNLNSGNFKINHYPILENNSDYNELTKQFKTIQKYIKTSRNHLDNLENHIQSWTWNDIVSQAYKEIFTAEVIIEVQKNEEDLERDLEFRIEYKIAPGFKDSKKPDDGIGDLVIWQTILELAKDKESDIVFVTNDQKNDWFYKQDKIGLYPKYELFDEFRRYTNGKSISIINFIKFLELSNAKAETIKDVKTTLEENLSVEIISSHYGLIEGMEVEHPKFGKGKILSLDKMGVNETAIVKFNEFGIKTLLVRFSSLKILDTGLNFLLQNPNFDGDPRTYQIKENAEEEDNP
jgi:predicted nucleic acid-binding protein